MSKIHITRAVHKDTKASVSIESVESGLQDNIVCACCGAKLIANKGKKRAWYFSHYFDEACILAYETQLHLTAKEYFAKVGKIPLPLDTGWVAPDACSELNISGVQVEVYMDGRRPDLVVEVGSEQYWVEIANKHKCDADKIWDCRSNDKNVIEIDVSDCGQLDQFDSLDNCLIRLQSLNPCNDYLDVIASNTATKHETVRKQFEALMRSQKQLKKEESQQEKATKVLEERIEDQQKKYDDRLEKMRFRESAQDEILAELERAIGAHETLLHEVKMRKENLENEMDEKVDLRLAELDELNEVELAVLKRKLDEEWQQEKELQRERFEQELADDFQRRFQIELDAMEVRKQAHEKLANELRALEHEKSFLRDEVDSLVVNKELIQEQQAKQIEAQLAPLIAQRNALFDEVARLTSMVEEKLVEHDLIDTYGNNIEEVKEFCLARTDYRQTLHQRVQEFKAIERQCNTLRAEYEEKYVQLDVIIKLANEYVAAFKNGFDVLQKKELLALLPPKLVSRIQTRLIMLSRNAQEELDDYERLKSNV
ncbi:competence protein CoiA family protein [Vibrio scophthalmi]|uniref:competence protein CoiA family protein n=1 Tax=Vibrio scophthalmi TaxID=45658 RepID=UPI003EB870D6